MIALKTCTTPDIFHNQLLAREFDIGSTLEHPGIVKFLSFVKDTPVGPAIMMEYLDGRSLDEFIAENHPKRARLKILQDILDAVEYLHKKGVVHNDLKPENIIITNSGDNVKIIDFSLADSDAWYLTHNLGGTVGTSAPEVMNGNPQAKADMRADIYSIGILIKGMFKRPRYARIIGKCTRVNPEFRYGSINDLRVALNAPVWPVFLLAACVVAAAIFALMTLTPADRSIAPQETAILPDALEPAATEYIPQTGPQETEPKQAPEPKQEQEPKQELKPEPKQEQESKPKPEPKASIEMPKPQETDDSMEMVDLGLSVKWATCNLGAASPEEAGDSYAWGEIRTKKVCQLSNYKFVINDTTLTKYNFDPKYGPVDGRSVLEPEDDAATVNWGCQWHTPTIDEWRELKDNCKWEWSDETGVRGIKVTATNGNSIFLPIAGLKGDEASQANQANTIFAYHSSSLNKDSRRSRYIHAVYPEMIQLYVGGRRYGLQVRPVTKDSTLNNTVDMGTSVLWATCNVGASSQYEIGDYFAWGETSAKNGPYKINNTKYISCKTTYTKYCLDAERGLVDGKSVLEAEDDVAHVKSGGKWRMPTIVEFDELSDNCSSEWTTLNGVYGRKFTSKKSGYTDKWIFLPAAGYRHGNCLHKVGYGGYYWTSSLSTAYSHNAHDLVFYSNSSITKRGGRFCGLSVRPVSDK